MIDPNSIEPVGVDPVSGNEVPPGATAKEVRDDVDVSVSEGEYIFPADVVRYYGVAKLEQMKDSAKKGIAEVMEKQAGNKNEFFLGGLFGGSKAAKAASNISGTQPRQPDPFDPSEWALGNFLSMAYQPTPLPAGGEGTTSARSGGREYRTYTDRNGRLINVEFINGEPQGDIPYGYFPQGQGSYADSRNPNREEGTDRKDNGLNNNYDEWGVEEFNDFADRAGNLGFLDKIPGLGGGLLGNVIKKAATSGVTKAEAAARLKATSEELSAEERAGLTAAADRLSEQLKSMETETSTGTTKRGGLLSNIFSSPARPTTTPEKKSYSKAGSNAAEESAYGARSRTPASTSGQSSSSWMSAPTGRGPREKTGDSPGSSGHGSSSSSSGGRSSYSGGSSSFSGGRAKSSGGKSYSEGSSGSSGGRSKSSGGKSGSSGSSGSSSGTGGQTSGGSGRSGQQMSKGGLVTKRKK